MDFLIYKINDLNRVLDQAYLKTTLWSEKSDSLMLRRKESMAALIKLKAEFQFGYLFLVPMRDHRNLNTSDDTFLPLSHGGYGLDYHIRLERSMQKITSKLKNDFLVQVDKGPIPEREIAIGAKVGQIGKNNCFFHEKLGSFLSIGLLFTQEPLPAEMITSEAPKQNFLPCENCNRCICACPTQALSAENPKQCLSYLLQAKDQEIYKYREKLGQSVYGCHICQEVCPYNQKVLKNRKMLSKNTTNLLAQDLIFLSNRAFKKKYGKNAFSWRGKNIILRNALLWAINNDRPLFGRDSLDGLKQEEILKQAIFLYEAHFKF